MSPKPKHLILNLLMVSKGGTSVKQFIRAGLLFNITENNIRVTLTRLVSDHMIEMCGHGRYTLGSAAQDLAQDLSGWRELEQRVCDWDGAWIAVYIGVLGRTNRRALASRMRILHLAGFQELLKGMWLRPNNLVGGVKSLRERLHRLGLEREAMVVVVSDMDLATQQRAQQLWNVDGLNEYYQEACQQMQQWSAKAVDLSIDTAARESFLIGDGAIRKIVFDPLLPAEMVDVQARQKFIQAMVEYDKIGRLAWDKLYQELLA